MDGGSGVDGGWMDGLAGLTGWEMALSGRGWRKGAAVGGRRVP
jgi:hypothetical protein